MGSYLSRIEKNPTQKNIWLMKKALTVIAFVLNGGLFGKSEEYPWKIEFTGEPLCV